MRILLSYIENLIHNGVGKGQRGNSIAQRKRHEKAEFRRRRTFPLPEVSRRTLQYSKESLKLESVSIISNGSRIKEYWFDKYAQYLDILGISCDSFDEAINTKIGRGKGEHSIKNILKIRDLCYVYDIKFKLNTVVSD